MMMAVLPLGFTANPNAPSKSVGKSSAEPHIAAVAALCDSGFCDEAIRALAVLEKTNAAAGQAAADGSNISDKEIYSRAERIYNSNNEILTFEGKPVAIPAGVCSNGFTEADGGVEYLEATASPWDAFSKRYSKSLSCRGVSADGINYLCQSGLSAEEALGWYLPKLSPSHQPAAVS